MNKLKIYDLSGMEADELIADITDVKTKLETCLKAVEQGELNEIQVNFLKQLNIW